MTIQPIPAMTGAEIAHCSMLPPKYAWMACRFATGDEGLSDLPEKIAHSTMLILNDEIPLKNHDPQRIVHQLSFLRPTEVLLDFQRSPTPEAHALTRSLVQALPCPVAAPPAYAQALDCPVYLPPVPPHVPAVEHLHPWKDREVWLELALDASEITITAQGSTTRSLPFAEPVETARQDKDLHCHYAIFEDTNALRFYLYRTRSDTLDLLSSSDFPNLKYAIGLFQEFW